MSVQKKKDKSAECTNSLVTVRVFCIQGINPVFTWHDALPLHSDVLIPVLAGVFMMKPQSMNDLMAEIPHATRAGVKYRLGSSLTTNKGHTARETNRKKPVRQKSRFTQIIKKKPFLSFN